MTTTRERALEAPKSKQFASREEALEHALRGLLKSRSNVAVTVAQIALASTPEQFALPPSPQPPPVAEGEWKVEPRGCRFQLVCNGRVYATGDEYGLRYIMRKMGFRP